MPAATEAKVKEVRRVGSQHSTLRESFDSRKSKITLKLTLTRTRPFALSQRKELFVQLEGHVVFISEPDKLLNLGEI